MPQKSQIFNNKKKEREKQSIYRKSFSLKRMEGKKTKKKQVIVESKWKEKGKNFIFE